MEPEDPISKGGNSGREWNFKKSLTEEEHGVKTLWVQRRETVVDKEEPRKGGNPMLPIPSNVAAFALGVS